MNPIASVRGLPSFSGTGVTDAGLKHLLALPRLEKLYLEGTQATDAAIDTSRPCPV